jgi:hypothetical protein
VISEIIPYLISAVTFWVFIIFAQVNFAILMPIYLFYIGGSSPTAELCTSTDHACRNGESTFERFGHLVLKRQSVGMAC